MDQRTQTCTRCKRLRLEKYMIRRKTKWGKTVWRCRARSVCSTKGRRLREAARKMEN